MVILEAMASALPVVATEVPGYLSVVEPGVDALTVRPRSPVELGAALTVLARDRDLRARLGASGLAKARRYAWREIAARVIDVYRSAREIAGAGIEDVHEQIPGLGPA